MMDETIRAEIAGRLKALVHSVAPDAEFVAKYGGTIIQSAPGQPKSQFCGVFEYKNHVSLEFTNGAQLDDPKKILEGSGKHHRHLKFVSMADIDDKESKDFLRQAYRLQNSLT
ncbi:DUF1801 domain-containing protein [uncultured Microbulbifer sp.]|uniref:DUF1801 domain-containing protein n=1 Tax=uncultured Microbulbifer sp. TaxID=348147 RepID=UPI002602AF69|nr:DUF1801 domain-containing protein [uncultured Microbulbifer sp.]